MTPQIVVMMLAGAVVGLWRFKTDVAPKATWLESVRFIGPRPGLFVRYLTRWAVIAGGCAYVAGLLAGRS